MKKDTIELRDLFSSRERVAFRIIMRKLGNNDATKSELTNIIQKPYLMSNQKEAQNFIEYIIGMDYLPVKYQNGTVFRTDIYN